jgi:hypothetical protein
MMRANMRKTEGIMVPGELFFLLYLNIYNQTTQKISIFPNFCLTLVFGIT